MSLHQTTVMKDPNRKVPKTDEERALLAALTPPELELCAKFGQDPLDFALLRHDFKARQARLRASTVPDPWNE